MEDPSPPIHRQGRRRVDRLTKGRQDEGFSGAREHRAQQTVWEGKGRGGFWEIVLRLAV